VAGFFNPRLLDANRFSVNGFRAMFSRRRRNRLCMAL